MAEIYIHIPGGEQLSIVPEASSLQDWALMGDNKLSLSFQRYECLILPAGAWCEFDGVIFYLLQEYKPTMIHSHLWQYNVAFVDGASWLGVTTALKTIDGEDAPLFTLTAPAIEHAAIIVSNLNRRLGSIVWKVGSVIDTPNITIEYTGKYCGAVLQEIVDDQNTEWWVDGTTLNIGRAEFGSLIELGYRDGLLGDITVTQADNMSSYRTLYPVGSTRNILPTEYGHDRLQLPNGQKSVMMNPAGVAELVEEAAFAGIYPRYKGKVTAVSTSIGQSNDGSQYLIYYIADAAMPFNPNDYEIPGLVKHITFQSGELMGAEFEVNYNPASNEFELITQFQENGSQLPGGMLIPKVGDEYVVWNISMPAEYYPLAEQELLEAAESFAAASTRESNVYKVKLDYIEVQERGLSLRPGQKVRLHSLDYFPEQGYYDSRITRVTRPVNYPGEYTIDVSAVRVVGSLTRLQTSLAAATTKVNNLSNTVQTVVQTVSNAVTLTGNQRVQGVKNFVDGISVNGSPIIEYDSAINTWLFRGNVLAEGGFAAFSNIKGFTPSTITDAVLIDGRTIRQNADGLLYVDPSAIGGGGLDEDALEAYLVANAYATQSWVENQKYITSSALNGYATESWVLSQKYLTGISSSMITNALGYTPYNSADFTKANIKSTLGISDWALEEYPTYLMPYGSVVAGKWAEPHGLSAGGWLSNDSGFGYAYGTTLNITYNMWSHRLAFRTDGIIDHWMGINTYEMSKVGQLAHISDIPTYLSQLTDDVVAGKYLSLAGGTVNGNINLSNPNCYIMLDTHQYGTDSAYSDIRWSSAVLDRYGYIRFYSGAYGHPKRVEIGGVDIDNSSLSIPLHVHGGGIFTQGLSCDNLQIYSTTSINPLSVAGNNRSGFIGIGSYSNGVYSRYGLISFPNENSSLYRYDNSYNAFEILDSNNIGSYNAGSATKLQTPRTIWGQSFDGSENIWGDLTNVGNIYSRGAQNGGYVIYSSIRWDEALSIEVTDAAGNWLTQGITVKTNGNVSLGGTTADAKLHVHGDLIAQNTFGGAIFKFDNSVGQNRAALVLDPNSNNGVAAGADYLTLEQRMDGSAILATPFLVLGLGIDKTLSVSGNILATGGVTAQNSSDERLKRNIRKFNASKVLMSLGGVWEYEYIDSEVQKNHIYEGTHYGLIYQNVKGTALDAMCHERDDGFGTLNYIHQKFLSLITGATIENITEVEKLKREIRHLKQKVKQLEQRA